MVVVRRRKLGRGRSLELNWLRVSHHVCGFLSRNGFAKNQNYCAARKARQSIELVSRRSMLSWLIDAAFLRGPSIRNSKNHIQYEKVPGSYRSLQHLFDARHLTQPPSRLQDVFQQPGHHLPPHPFSLLLLRALARFFIVLLQCLQGRSRMEGVNRWRLERIIVCQTRIRSITSRPGWHFGLVRLRFRFVVDGARGFFLGMR
jgi:hypothetical protein